MAGCTEWQTVRRRKGAAARKTQTPATPATPEPPEACDSQRDCERIKEAMKELRTEDFCLEWRELLRVSLVKFGGSSSIDEAERESEGLLDCVCYGLGNFSHCVSARYQLAMLLLLMETLKIPVDGCKIYDPVFTVSERGTLTKLGFTVLIENEEGKREVFRPTLFYMIHCGKALYNNLLWKNWSPQALPKLVLIGNSFLGIQERMLEKDFKRDYSFISDIIGACVETSLPCSQHFMDVFNDTAIIRFPPDKLHALPECIWTEASEPQYQHCQDLEIIQRESGRR